MLYGNIIFIKKSGGDGSRYPVNNVNVKIGRSEDCQIRIQNPLVSPEHCQLIISENGRAKLKNLSTENPTVVNDKPLGSEEYTLNNGDIFKLGDRFARWEYLPSFKFFTKSESTFERPVAVVSPVKRISVTGSGAGTGKLNSSGLLRSSGGFSGRRSIKRLSLNNVRPGSNKSKLLGRLSLQLKQNPSSPQVRLRKSMLPESSGSRSTSSTVRTPRKSSKSWEVKLVTPPNKGSASKSGTSRKSTPIKMSGPDPSSSWHIKSVTKSSSKAPNLMTISESSPTSAELDLIKRKKSNRISGGSSPESGSTTKSSQISPKKMKLALPRKSLQRSSRISRASAVFSSEDSPSSTERKSGSSRYSHQSTPIVKSTQRKSLLKKSVLTSINDASSPSISSKTSETSPSPRTDSKKLKLSPVGKNVRTPKTSKTAEKTDKKFQSKPSGRLSEKLSKSLSGSTMRGKQQLERSRKSMPARVSVTPKGKRKVSLARKSIGATKGVLRTSQAGAVKRKFASSAAVAAKKLKTIEPTKPDKNKKAALLVLGKAGLAMKNIQSANVLMKKKIVRKAIKQSTKVKAATKSKKQEKVENASPKVQNETTKSPRSTSKDAKSPKSPESHKTPQSDSSKGKSKVENSSSSTKKISRAKTSLVKSSSTPSSSVKDLKFEHVNSKSSKKSPVKRSSAQFTSTPRHPTVSNDIGMQNESSSLKRQDKSPFNASVVLVQNDVSAVSIRSLRQSQFDNSNGQPEFTELSPSALGLTPKNTVKMFKTPKQVSRRSSSLVTPKNSTTPGIIKSASTSKINRKSVRFSSRGLTDSSFTELNLTNCTSFDFGAIKTPEITMDVFISPLTEASSLKKKSETSKSGRESTSPSEAAQKSLNYTKTPKLDENKGRKTPKSSVVKNSEDLFSSPKEKSNKRKSMRSPKDDSCSNKSLKRSLSDSSDLGVRPLRTPKSPKTSAVDTPVKDEIQKVTKKGPAMKTPKSPKNDLTDVRGVKRLMKTPKPAISPKNDLTDVRGVKRLMTSPKWQKSPKNDLTDVRGVKRLMTSPKEQKSPKNDLTDVRGVKRLMTSPKQQKPPKNDLTDVRGVKQLMTTPKRQKSPKNDLTDVRGVKRLMTSPKEQKSPKNDLTDVRGVKRLMTSPKQQKAPKNDLTDVRGVKRLMTTPKRQKSPKNDLTDVTGVKQLLITRSPKNDLSNVSSVESLFKSLPNKIQCLRTLYKPVSKSPKNDLRNVSGVRQLFSMNKETNNLDISLTGVAELFMSSEVLKETQDDEPPRAKQPRTARLIAEETALQKRRSTRTPVKGKAEAKTDVQSSDTEESTKRATRSRATAKEGTPAKPERSRTKSESKSSSQSKAKSKATKGEEVAEPVARTGKSSRAAAKTTETAPKKTSAKRKVTVEESAVATPTKRTRSAKNEEKVAAKEEPADDPSKSDSEPSPVKTRSKSVAKSASKATSAKSTRPKIAVKSTRAKAKSAKASSSIEESVSPVRTRSRKVKVSGTTTPPKRNLRTRV